MAARLTTKKRNEALARENKELRHYGLVLRIFPTEEQANLCQQTFGCARLIYNQYLGKRQSHYYEYQETLKVKTFKSENLTPMKRTEEFAFLKEVDKFALEVACESVDDAYTRFFKGQNRYPRFKTKRKAKKSYTTKYTNNNIDIVSTSQLKLPKLGRLRIAKLKTKRNKTILERISTGEVRILKATISEQGSRYYASLCLEEVVDQVKPLALKEIEPSKVVGIDLGLKTYAVITNGEGFENVERKRFIKVSEKKLAKLQRRLSKKTLDSENFKKAKNKVAALQHHIANQRKDFTHKLSTRLANENQVAVLETLNIKRMVKNRKLAKSISDAGWSQFKIFLKYKMERQGKHLIQVDRWYASSKLCSVCDEKKIALSLNEREWVCSTCGTAHDRDDNASTNIRKEGMRLLELAV